MPYQLIKADGLIPEDVNRPLVYLGGSQRGRDWRSDLYHRFEQTDVTFVNPKRDAFPDPEIDPVGHAQVVEWEKEMLDASDIAIFWLGEGLANQASRVEIGYCIGEKKPVLIGAEQGFLGQEHLTAFSGLVLSTSLDGLMNRFSSLLNSFRAE